MWPVIKCQVNTISRKFSNYFWKNFYLDLILKSSNSPIKEGSATLKIKSKTDALKAEALSIPTFPRKNTEALSRIPRSPIAIGNAVFVKKIAEVAFSRSVISLGEKAKIKIQNCSVKIQKNSSEKR